MSSGVGYSLEQVGAEEHERARLGLLEQLWDPITARLLDAIGVADGWHCLDVGAGSGSVVKLLAGRVGPSGSVLATDLETALLEPLANDRIEVRHHDLLADPLPERAFDLVHARIVLMHLPSRLDALKRMMSAVRPGGVLAIGEGTMSDMKLCSPPSAAWERTWSAFLDVLVQTGWDARYGARVIGDLEALGLDDVRAEQIQLYERGSSIPAQVISATIERLRPRMDASSEDIDEALRILASPASSFWFVSLVFAWGRSP